jgi:ABC-type Na+ efflux pump permease subunit
VVSGDFADVSKMADEESLGIVQFVIILLITLVFGGVLIAIVLFVGRKKQEKDSSNDSRPENKVEDLKNGKENAANTVSKKTSKNSKRVQGSNDHPKQLCILKGHTSDVLYIEFTTNGKLLGSTSSGRILQMDTCANLYFSVSWS